ncbi:S9 family peptidase [uncultured Friedmanniella sp.]|uniref:S9 family peptidase n=1 Tax=uncultured Friedmanniella sp. TaxID=335381 RepID=UPI0035CBC894
MTPDDLDLLRTVSPPSLTPDGRTAFFAVTRPNVGADAYVGQLWRAPVDGSRPAERLTLGSRDTVPHVSPDGSLIAFLRATVDGPAQLHVVRADGGEPVRLTDAPLGVGELAWSGDSTRLVYVARVPEPGRYGTVEGLSAAAEPPRRLATTRYLANGVGHVTDRRAQLFTVTVPDVGAEPVVPRAPSADEPTPEQPTGLPEAVQLTFDDADHEAPSVTADGSVTFVAALDDGRSDVLRSAAYRLVLGPDGRPGAVTQVAGPDQGLFVHQVREVTGRTWLLAQAIDPAGADFVGVHTALYVREGDAAPRRLTDPETVDLQGSAIVPDGEDVLVTEVTRGTVALLRVDAAGQSQRLTDGPVEVIGMAAAGGRVVATYADPRTTGDVAVVEEDGLRPLTDLSAPLRAAGVRPPEELVVPARDGGEVHGWLLEPAGPGPHPTLLLIHGGPFAQFTGSLFDEAQVYVGGGYAVVMGNPRGSAGYGQAHGRSIRQRLGTVDLTDVLDLLEGALEAQPSLDRDRLGIMGGSYGGYLSAWTIAHDHRFAGAIVERGYLDPELFIGTSDIGTYFSEQYTGDDPEQRRAQSPQAVVDQVRTPTLVIHSVDDLRCPLSQAQRYHLGLVRAGVETELLVFPGENHELSRSGRPRHRVQRFIAILDWWSRYLPI